MSHSVTLFNQFSLKNMVFVLANFSTQTHMKIRIRKNEILTKNTDLSGYQLTNGNKLIFVDNHLNSKKFISESLQELKQIEVKSKLKVKEIQKLKRLNKSRILSTKLALIS